MQVHIQHVVRSNNQYLWINTFHTAIIFYTSSVQKSLIFYLSYNLGRCKFFCKPGVSRELIDIESGQIYYNPQLPLLSLWEKKKSHLPLKWQHQHSILNLKNSLKCLDDFAKTYLFPDDVHGIHIQRGHITQWLVKTF